MTAARLADKIEQWPMARRLPCTRNARTHSEEQVAQIADSLNTLGCTDYRFCIENDCYVVDQAGHVYRVCRRQRSKSGRLIQKYDTVRLAGSLDVDGYKVYRMLVDGVKKHVKGHRIVLNAYAGVRNDLCVNHKNGVKSDNRLVNLEWVTVAENNAHAIRTGLLDPRKADHSWRNKVFKADYVTIYALHTCFGVPRIVLAQRNRVSRQTIDKVVATVHRHVGRFYGAA